MNIYISSEYIFFLLLFIYLHIVDLNTFCSFFSFFFSISFPSSERVGKDKRVERAVGLCKKVVAAFSLACWKKKRDLATAQEELKLPRHKMVTESPTRWGSRQKMVARVIEQHKAISQVKKSAFKFDRNKDLTFIVIIIDID